MDVTRNYSKLSTYHFTFIFKTAIFKIQKIDLFSKNHLNMALKTTMFYLQHRW